MADTTAKWAIPRPELADDPPDVPRDFVAAMNRVDDLLTPISRGIFAAMPPFGKLGQRYVATDQDNQEYLDLGDRWIPLNITRGLTVGDVKWSFQNADHGDWRLLDGRNNILRSTVTQDFVDLMLARGYPGSDGTRIGVPDAMGRVPVGVGSHANIDTLGKTDNLALANRRPYHKHTVNDPGHYHGITDPGHYHSTHYQFGSTAANNWPNLPLFDQQGRQFDTNIDTNPPAGSNGYTHITINPTNTGVTVGPQANSPTDGPAFITLNPFIYIGATVETSGGGGVTGTGLQDASEVDIATANLAPGAGQSGVVALGSGWRALRIQADHPCRVRLYGSPAKRDADVARPAATDPPDYPAVGASPNHQCMLEVILTAAHLSGGVYIQDLAPNVVGASAEIPRANAIAYRIDNTDVAAHVVNVAILSQVLESGV